MGDSKAHSQHPKIGLTIWKYYVMIVLLLSLFIDVCQCFSLIPIPNSVPVDKHSHKPFSSRRTTPMHSRRNIPTSSSFLSCFSQSNRLCSYPPTHTHTYPRTHTRTSMSISSIPSITHKIYTSSIISPTTNHPISTQLLMTKNQYNIYEDDINDDDPNAQENDENDMNEEEDTMEGLSDLTLSEFLKRQGEIMSGRSTQNKGNPKRSSGIRNRVSRWLKFNKKQTPSSKEEDGNTDNTDEPTSGTSKDPSFSQPDGPSPPVKPLQLDGTPAPAPYDTTHKKDNELENIVEEELKSIDGIDDMDVRTRAKKMREIQKEKRLQKAMEELKLQLDNSPEDIVKNTPTNNYNEEKKGKPKVIRPNFDDLFQGVPGLDDLLGDTPLSSSDATSSSSSRSANSNNDDNKNEKGNTNAPRLDSDGNIVFDSNLSNEEQNDNEMEEEEEEDMIGSDEFYRMEQEMRKQTGLTSRPKDDNDDDGNIIDPSLMEGPVKSREEINLEALASLEQLQKKRYGDSYIESNAVKSVRNLSSSSLPTGDNDDVPKEEEDTPEMRFRRMEEEMRKKTGLTALPKKKQKDEEVQDESNNGPREDITPEIAKEIRSKLSEDALLTLESLRRKKLGDDYVEMDKEEILRKMEEIVGDQNNERDMLQDDDTFLGDDEIAAWDDSRSEVNQPFPDDSNVNNSQLPNMDDPSSQSSQEENADNLFTKKASASDQIYRSIAAKSGGNVNDEKRSEWEAFLAREQEMREKMGMIDSGDNLDQVGKNEMDGVPNSGFFSDQDDMTSNDSDQITDNIEEGRETPVNAPFDMDQRQEASVSSQIYRSIAAKQGASEQGTEADFQAYFEKEAAMREKMGMSNSDEEANDDGRLDLSDVFADAFNDNVIENRDDGSSSKPRTNQLYVDYRDNEIIENDVDDVDESTEAWMRAKESSLNMDDDDLDNDVDDWIHKREEMVDEEKGSKDNDMLNNDVPSTPFFQDYQNEETETSLEEKIYEKQQDDYVNSDPSFPSSKYAFDPKDLSDLFNRDNDDEADVYPEKVGLDSFSSYNARKADLLERTELAVEDLNALGEFNPMAKLSMKLKPDSAFGSILRLEGTLVDTTEMQMEAWTKVADLYGFQPPLWEEVQRAQLILGDEAVRTIFFWTFDVMESRDIALSHYDALQEVFKDVMRKYEEIEYRKSLGENLDDLSPILKVNEGAIEWLERLRGVGMPCAVISQLDREKLDDVLRVSLLDEFFPEDRRVSSNCGYGQESQEMLGAALRLQRRPDHCVVFDTSPSSAIAAHDVEMKSVGLLGLFALYELSTADMTIPSFDELSVINIRRLFSDENFDEPVMELERQKPERDRDPRIRTWAEGDRF